ncbi:MAG TPA: hypothetical protein VF112_02095 [Candidatus Dormibacteraeota bacterium]
MAGQLTKAVGAGIGWGIGMGLTLGAAGALAGGLRPIAKSAIRAGLAVSERVTATGAEAWEQAQDLYHEVLEERNGGGGGGSANGSQRSATLSIPGGGRT